jgi:hypothetical protein
VLSIDLTASTAGILEIEHDGASIAGDYAPLTGTNTFLQWDRDTGLLGTFGGGAVMDAQISEFFIHDAYIPPAILWNGGVKGNLAALAGVSPLIYFGNGSAAAAWNSAANSGTATIGVGSGTFSTV